MKNRGFTLIELMIAVAIVGILAAVALPSYRNSVLKSQRIDAKTALLDLASREERYFTTNNAYTIDPAKLGYAGTFPVTVPNSNVATYSLNITIATGGASFTGTAAPTTRQLNDTCGTYSIDSLGVQSNSNNTTASATCW